MTAFRGRVTTYTTVLLYCTIVRTQNAYVRRRLCVRELKARAYDNADGVKKTKNPILRIHYIDSSHTDENCVARTNSVSYYIGIVRIEK